MEIIRWSLDYVLLPALFVLIIVIYFVARRWRGWRFGYRDCVFWIWFLLCLPLVAEPFFPRDWFPGSLILISRLLLGGAITLVYLVDWPWGKARDKAAVKRG